MSKVAIAFSTKNRLELTKRSLQSLLQPDKFDLFWSDGSTEEAAIKFATDHGDACNLHMNIGGGADYAIAYNLTTMLGHSRRYDYIGLVENDVLLYQNWFPQTMALFQRGADDGLAVGAVSARAYEDRVLIQRDGYAVMHNLGAGMAIYSRAAAEAVLGNFRTGWWTENRRTFMQVSGLDIGRYAAFRVNEQWVTADWRSEQVLAELGYAALALTPSHVQMIGQDPPLEQQGLKLVQSPVELLRDDTRFKQFVLRTDLRAKKFACMPNRTEWFQADDGTFTIFPHQIGAISGSHYRGDWRLKWAQGFGPFAYQAGHEVVAFPSATLPIQGTKFPTLTVMISGACSFMVSGGERGGKVRVIDSASGYDISPDLPAEGSTTQVLNLPIPGGVSYRAVTLEMLTPGTVFYALQCREPQPYNKHGYSFDATKLPPV